MDLTSSASNVFSPSFPASVNSLISLFLFLFLFFLAFVLRPDLFIVEACREIQDRMISMNQSIESRLDETLTTMVLLRPIVRAES